MFQKIFQQRAKKGGDYYFKGSFTLAIGHHCHNKVMTTVCLELSCIMLERLHLSFYI